MKIKFTSYETAYNRHIRLARKACSELTGRERAEAIRNYFIDAGHPHSEYTFNQMAMNRRSDHQFAIDLMKDMADLCAKNESGYVFNGIDGVWNREKTVGELCYRHTYINRYSVHGNPNNKQLIVCESDDGEVINYKNFNDCLEYEKWVDEVVGEDWTPGDSVYLVRKIIEELTPEFEYQ